MQVNGGQHPTLSDLEENRLCFILLFNLNWYINLILFLDKLKKGGGGVKVQS